MTVTNTEGDSVMPAQLAKDGFVQVAVIDQRAARRLVVATGMLVGHGPRHFELQAARRLDSLVQISCAQLDAEIGTVTFAQLGELADHIGRQPTDIGKGYHLDDGNPTNWVLWIRPQPARTWVGIEPATVEKDKIQPHTYITDKPLAVANRFAKKDSGMKDVRLVPDGHRLWVANYQNRAMGYVDPVWGAAVCILMQAGERWTATHLGFGEDESGQPDTDHVAAYLERPPTPPPPVLTLPGLD